MTVGAARSLLFAITNVAAVWLIFFGPTVAGTKMMALYLAIIVGFWVLLFTFKKHQDICF